MDSSLKRLLFTKDDVKMLCEPAEDDPTNYLDGLRTAQHVLEQVLNVAASANKKRKEASDRIPRTVIAKIPR